jgi:DNA-binding protein HU-beta
MPKQLTPEIIVAAIAGFEQQKTHIDAQIAELRAMLSGGPSEPTAKPEAPTKDKRREFSAAARRRMKEAPRKRWAKIRGESAPPTPATPEAPKPKGRLSEAGRAAIAAATRKRWAAKRAAAAKPVSAAKKTAAKKTAAKKTPATSAV